MKMKNFKIGLQARVGILLILIAISNVYTYTNLPPNSNKTVISPQITNLPGGSNQITSTSVNYFLLIQKNQFLKIEGTCSSCESPVVLNLSIQDITNYDYLNNVTVKNLSLKVNESTERVISLDPSNYAVIVTLQGSSSITLIITGYGVPYSFIYLNSLIFVIGLVTILVNKRIFYKFSNI